MLQAGQGQHTAYSQPRYVVNHLLYDYELGRLALQQLHMYSCPRLLHEEAELAPTQPNT